MESGSVDDWLTDLQRDGFVILPAVFTPAEVDAARAACAAALADPAAAGSLLANAGQPPHGARNLLDVWPGSIDLARAPALAEAVCRVLGPAAGVVRGLYFDKPPGEGWALPW